MDLGAATFNALFATSPSGIIKRICSSCAATHQEVYYKRHHSRDGWNAHHNMGWAWASSSNALHDHFDLFSTYPDAVAGANPWSYCNFDGSGVGFARDCGPTGSVGGQWTSWTRSDDTRIDVAFYIETALTHDVVTDIVIQPPCASGQTCGEFTLASEPCRAPVSYTHLTLPTICSV